MREYEETLTTIVVHSGLPKMMSRVLVCLYTTDSGSLTASELVQRLQVSPASISKAITFLENLDPSAGNATTPPRARRRRRRPLVPVDVRSARDNAQLAETARQGVGILGPDTPAAARLDNIARYLDFVAESITRAARRPARSSSRKPKRPQPAVLSQVQIVDREAGV